jgi:protoheme IX farnesyltransferase
MSLVIGSACVFNNYLDRDIDRRMDRTKKRALVSGLIKPETALIFATTLGILGFAALVLFTNALVTAIGAVAMLFYVVIYYGE